MDPIWVSVGVKCVTLDPASAANKKENGFFYIKKSKFQIDNMAYTQSALTNSWRQLTGEDFEL